MLGANSFRQVLNHMHHGGALPCRIGQRSGIDAQVRPLSTLLLQDAPHLKKNFATVQDSSIGQILFTKPTPRVIHPRDARDVHWLLRRLRQGDPQNLLNSLIGKQNPALGIDEEHGCDVRQQQPFEQVLRILEFPVQRVRSRRLAGADKPGAPQASNYPVASIDPGDDVSAEGTTPPLEFADLQATVQGSSVCLDQSRLALRQPKILVQIEGIRPLG